MLETPEPNSELTGHQRWLLSYADFLTLLFALFVVLFASAYTRKKPTPPPPAPLQLAPTRNLLLDRLSREIQAAHVEIKPEMRGLVIVLKDASFFKPGDDEILPESYSAID
jgi:flagellar motor protein MotB